MDKEEDYPAVEIKSQEEPSRASQQKAVSPVSSCVSFKSDWSKMGPPDFSVEPGPSEALQKAVSPVSSCVSLKSDWSKMGPPDFSIEPGPSETLQKAVSPVSSCVSLKSDWSKMGPPDFSIEPGPSETLGKKLPEVVQETCRLHKTNLSDLKDEHKQSLRRRYESVVEGLDRAAPQTLFSSVYTELYLSEGRRHEADVKHELNWLETLTEKDTLPDSLTIKCSDIFKSFLKDQRPIRMVLTCGVAGVGKTFSIQKFTLDWAQGLENQELDLVVLLSFRELNLLSEDCCSLLELIHLFHPALKELTAQTLACSKVLFILDGFDESRLPLDFNCEKTSELTQTSKIPTVLVNLIRGDILPTAHIWITSRPAAANQIPSAYVDRVTEVRGFITDQQKEQYFSKRFTDQQQCKTVLSHIRTSHSLHTICQIPIFSWITATVLDHMLKTEQNEQLPQTLTDLYAHFLIVQAQRRTLKYPQEHTQELPEGRGLTKADRKLLLKLGRLAFEQLEKGNIMFYEKDLDQVGLNVTEAVVQAGVCSEIFKRDCVIFSKSIYCFIHLSVQEFLAAVYLMHSFMISNVMKWVLGSENQLAGINIFLRKILKKSLLSKNGHLDLVVRFLHGLCLDSNLKLLQTLLGPVEVDRRMTEKVIDNLKAMNVKNVSADRNINLIHCLMEMRYHNLQEEIQVILKAKMKSSRRLSDIQCSALAYMLQTSEEVIEELDMTTYDISQHGKERLVPAVRNCRKAVLNFELADVNCEIVASALMSDPSHLRELELTSLQESGIKILCSGLESPTCRLQALRLTWPKGETFTTPLTPLLTALKSNPSHFRELSLTLTTLQDSVGPLREFLQSPDCRLEKLRLIRCCLSELSCLLLASALKCIPHVKELDLSWNTPQDSGVEALSRFLMSPDCHLEKLRLEGCSLSESSCSFLASALKCNPSHLRELHLSENSDIKDSGVELLCGYLKNPDCRLKTLRLSFCSLSESGCSSLVSALKTNPSHLRELNLTKNSNITDSGVKRLCRYLRSPDCRLEKLRLEGCSLSECSCSFLASALKCNPSHLRELHLSENRDIKDSGVELLCGYLKNPDCRLETLRLSLCSLSESVCSSLVSALKSNPSHLRELDLTNNSDITDSGVELLCGYLQSPDCRLEKLRLKNVSTLSSSYSSIRSILKSGSCSLKELSATVNGQTYSEDKNLDRIGDCHLDIDFITPHNGYYDYSYDYGDVVDGDCDVLDNYGDVVDGDCDVLDNYGDVVDGDCDVLDNYGDVVDGDCDVLDNYGDVVDGDCDVLDNYGDVVDGDYDLWDNYGDVVDRDCDFLNDFGDVDYGDHNYY